MSDEKVVQLRPGQPAHVPITNDERDRILMENRDEMIEMLDGIRGRVMAFDIRGLAMVGFASTPDQDVTFLSRHTGVDVARTVGSVEFLKHAVIYDRLRQLDDLEDDYE